MVLSAQALELPLQFLAQPEGSRVGICGIRLLDAGGHVSTCCNRLPTLKNLLVEALGIEKLSGHAYDGRTVDPATLASSGVVEQIIGAFFLVRRAVFEALGGFDERFFVYFEEVDFSLRCRQLGYASYYLAEATAYHHGGGSSEQVLDKRLFYSLRSRMQYAKKHFGWYETLLLGSVTLLLEPLCRIAWALLRRQRRMVSHTIKAYARLWRFLVLETGQ
jgi:N-acetylglucosaminyl-diphospho-decaprenol L-rhamnosyltransferase